MTSRICSDWISSAGRLGTGPERRTRRFSTPGSRMASHGWASPASTLDRPISF